MQTKICKSLAFLLLSFLIIFVVYLTTFSKEETFSPSEVFVEDNEVSLLSYSNEEISSNAYMNCSNSIESQYESRPYDIEEVCNIWFIVMTDCKISSINYNVIGFDIVDTAEDKEQTFQFSIKINKNFNDNCFMFHVQLSNGQELVSKIYGYKSEEIYYISKASTDNINKLELEYKLEKNYISLEEYQKELDLFNQMNQNSLFDNQMEIKYNDVLLTTSGNSTSYYFGQFSFEVKEGVFHPLQFLLVELCINGTSVASNYTDANGKFHFEYQHSEPISVYIRLSSQGEKNCVRKNTITAVPYSTTSVTKNCTPGSSTSFETKLTNNSIENKAMLVCNAMNIGAKYVDAMGFTPPNAICHFPKDNNQYSSFWNVIDIEEDAYEYWDIILHEYGHKIQHDFDLSDSPGGSHYMNDDQISIHGKDKGMRLAWGEGWATFFSILSTQYFEEIIAKMPFVNDTDFHQYYYNAIGEKTTVWTDIEKLCANKGEGCEASIVEVLYDIHDKNSYLEPWDDLSLSHEDMFSAVMYSKATTFSEFYNFFIKTCYSVFDGKLGSILAHHNFSSLNLQVKDSSISSSVTPTFVWEEGGNLGNKFNKFQLQFYDDSNEVILTADTITINSYTLSNEEWNTILKNCKETFSVAVISYQMDNPVTGGYYSSKCIVPKPHIHQYTYTVKNSKLHTASCECGIVNTQPHSIRSSDVGQKYANCIQCGYLLSLGSDIGIVGPLSNNMNLSYVTKSGSYFLSSGVLVLAEMDIDAYLNGLYSFCKEEDLNYI